MRNAFVVFVLLLCSRVVVCERESGGEKEWKRERGEGVYTIWRCDMVHIGIYLLEQRGTHYENFGCMSLCIMCGVIPPHSANANMCVCV